MAQMYFNGVDITDIKRRSCKHKNCACGKHDTAPYGDDMQKVIALTQKTWYNYSVYGMI